LNNQTINSESDLNTKADIFIKSIFYKYIPAKYYEKVKVSDERYEKLKLDSDAEAYDE
jgi:hypothetical protein